MSRIRQKLERLHAPRPTRLPDGAEVVSIPAPGAREPERAPVAAEEPRAHASTEDATEGAARERKAKDRKPPPKGKQRARKPTADTAPAEDAQTHASDNLPPRFERSGPTTRSNPRQPTDVVRRGEFEAWRERRRARSIATLPNAVPAPAEPKPARGKAGGSKPAPAAATKRSHGPQDEAPRAEPTTPHAFFERALGAMARRAWGDAEADLRAAVDGLSGRERWTALKQLATLALVQDDLSEAERWLRQMVEIEGIFDPFALVELATLLEARGDEDEAAALMARARKLAPWLRS